jgi:hypothetical protein
MMASDPGNSDDNKPGNGTPGAPKPASPSPSGAPTGAPARGPFLIVTPRAGQAPGQTAPGQVQPARPAPKPAVPRPPEAKPADPEPRLIDPPARTAPAALPDEPILDGPDLEPLLGEPMPGEPTYEEADHHEPPRLVDPPPSTPQKPAPQKPEVQKRGQPAPGKPPQSTGPRPKPPSLAARSADRLAELNGPPPRGRGGCLTLLLILAILAGGGYFLWRAGKLDPVLSWAQPYTAPVIEKFRPIIDKIEALIPGHQGAPPPAASDEAMIIETKQLLQKLDFNPGPINGTLDPATVAAIEAYQEAAGLPIDGQPSQGLLDDLRNVANPSSN